VKNDIKWKEIYSTRNQGEIAIIKSIFEMNKIIYFIENENFMRLPCTIKVNEMQFEVAERLLKDFQKKQNLPPPI